MKKGFLKCAITLITLAIAFTIRAQTEDDPNDTGNGRAVGATINQGINNTLGNIGDSINSGASNVGKNINQGIANNQGLFSSAMQNSTNSLITWLNGNLVTGLPPKFSQSLKGNWQLMMANFSLSKLNWVLTQKFTMALLTGISPSDIEGEDTSVPIATTNLNDLKSQAGHFNIGSLLSKTTITSDEERNAQILLRFVSGLNNAVTALPSKAATSGMGPIDEFQNRFGTYLAQQSVGLNTLYNLLNERIVRKGLGAQVVGSGSEKDMSPLGLNEYMATRRLSTADGENSWYAQLSTITPAQMAKEQLMLLAEMRYQMYLTQQTLEQVATLLAVQQLQVNAENAAKLEQLKTQVMSASTSTILNH